MEQTYIQTDAVMWPPFDEEDMVSFGNYLLSEKRNQMIMGDTNIVHHVDLENWKFLNSEEVGTDEHKG